MLTIVVSDEKGLDFDDFESSLRRAVGKHHDKLPSNGNVLKMIVYSGQDYTEKICKKVRKIINEF